MKIDARRIGRTLADKRRAAGLTQAEVAARLGVTPARLTHWETACRGCAPSLRTLARLAEVYGTTIDDLLRTQPKE